MELIGKVLWWNERDGKGIIVDVQGNEFYFDSSVLNLKPRQNLKRKSIVMFTVNQSISDCLCACNIKLPSAEKKKTLEKKYIKETGSAV